MALTEHVPLMQSGATLRNVLVALLYFFLLPLVLVALPFYLLYAVGTNRNGLADTLADSPLGSIPTIENGGWQAAITVFIIAIVLLGVVGAVLPSADTPDDTTTGLDGNGDDGAGGGETSPADADTPTATDGGSDNAATATATAAATASATPTATAEPTATPRSEPETQSYSGSGQRVTDTVTIEGGLTVFTMEHTGGDSNFQVELINEDTGETEKYLANQIGEWQATQPYYIPPGDYVMDVNADGNWNIGVAQPRPSASEVSDLPASASDQYPDYIGPVRFDGLHTFSAEYNGEENFAVWVLDEDGRRVDLIFNEVGQFEGQNTYSGNHVGYIRIEATGDWNLEAE